MGSVIGYCSSLSVAPGDTVEFMVSCSGSASYRADIVRLVCADRNPRGPGFKEEPLETAVNGEYRGREQSLHCGSYVVVPPAAAITRVGSFTVQAFIWPTTPRKGAQGLVGTWSESTRGGFGLMLDETGALALVLGDGQDRVEVLSSGVRVRAREWYFVAGTYDGATREVCLYAMPLNGGRLPLAGAARRVTSRLPAVAAGPGPLVMAAWHRDDGKGRLRPGGRYNGKIDRPALANRVLAPEEMMMLADPASPYCCSAPVVGCWDFSRDISSDRVVDVSSYRHHGRTVNLPTRAVTGRNWNGSEMNWRHAPEQYGAIHFHDDDVYDAGWEADFRLTIPEGMRSGVYAARLQAAGASSHVVFFVRPAPGTATARIAYLAPTLTYLAYANIGRRPFSCDDYEVMHGQLSVLEPSDLHLLKHPELGLSTYDLHKDGSGVSISSRLRPILNLQSQERIWVFTADSHITAWLEQSGFGYDVITDEDLHAEGLDLLQRYAVVVTGTHPEYCSEEMLDGIRGYLDRGGRLMYLGANGFYWRTSVHREKPGVIEIRRAECGTRTWVAEPGEYYHSFTGEYGGLWRRQGRAPNRLVGVGFIGQGFDASTYYRRRPGSHDPRAAFIFEGVDDEILGNFGSVGGGAAGIELDCLSPDLGSPPHALVLASSENLSNTYFLTPECIWAMHGAVDATQNSSIRADMVFFECPGGGAVFSAGSIAYAGSLAYNRYDNDISRITTNVLRRFVDPEPFRMPDPEQAEPTAVPGSSTPARAPSH